MSKLLASALEIVAVLCLDGVLDGARHGIVDAENGALDELDLSGSIATEVSLLRELSLTPCLRGGCLAAAVRRRHARRHTEATGSIVLRVSGIAVAASGLSLGSIGLGQAVPRGGTSRRALLVGIIKGTAKGALVVLLLQKSSGGLVVMGSVVLFGD
jgi:hypothetical protein